jgi:hypothetical protein
MATTTNPMPSASWGIPKENRCAPELTSVPTSPRSRENDHADGVKQGPLGQHDRREQAEHHEGEVVRRTELERKLGERRSEQRKQEGGNRAREERTDRGSGQGHAGPSLTRHLVAVKRRDHRGGLTRHVDQDGRGRSAVLGAVVDAGEHDQRRDRREGEGHGQQHGDRGRRPESGQHADQRSKKDAGEAVQQVRQRDRCRETEAEVGKKFHAARLTRTNRKLLFPRRHEGTKSTVVTTHLDRSHHRKEILCALVSLR